MTFNFLELSVFLPRIIKRCVLRVLLLQIIRVSSVRKILPIPQKYKICYHSGKDNNFMLFVLAKIYVKHVLGN